MVAEAFAELAVQSAPVRRPVRELVCEYAVVVLLRGAVLRSAEQPLVRHLDEIRGWAIEGHLAAVPDVGMSRREERVGRLVALKDRDRWHIGEAEAVHLGDVEDVAVPQDEALAVVALVFRIG